jgi:hypothetical protein
MAESGGNDGEGDRGEPGIGSPALAVDNAELENVSIKVLHFTGETVTVGYESIPGNHPEKNGNRLWLWEGTVIDWTHPNLGINELVSNNDSKGSFTMTVEIGRKNYIVGYSVTGEVIGICGSAPVKAGQLLLAPTSVTIGIESIDKETLVIRYATLRGYRPLSSGNWLGLWPGDVLPWDAPTPIEVRPPEGDANEGFATFRGPLRSKWTYTVIYFMANKQQQTQNTSAAALLRFDTS